MRRLWMLFGMAIGGLVVWALTHTDRQLADRYRMQRTEQGRARRLRRIDETQPMMPQSVPLEPEAPRSHPRRNPSDAPESEYWQKWDDLEDAVDGQV